MPDATILCWKRDPDDSGGYRAEHAGCTYAVAWNDNEPNGSSIGWIAQVDLVSENRWLSDGEPRMRDAKALCERHAQRLDAAVSHAPLLRAKDHPRDGTSVLFRVRAIAAGAESTSSLAVALAALRHIRRVTTGRQ